MAYAKHIWQCDEPITAKKLNHIEEGIANAGGKLLITGGNLPGDALNHTFAEIEQAIASRGVVFQFVPSAPSEYTPFYTQDISVSCGNLFYTRYVTVFYPDEGESGEIKKYYADSDDDYPHLPSNS